MEIICHNFFYKGLNIGKNKTVGCVSTLISKMNKINCKLNIKSYAYLFKLNVEINFR